MGRLIIAMASVLLTVGAGGCGIPHRLDRDPRVQEFVLGSRFIAVDAIPTRTREAPPMDLPAGTVIEVVHAESTNRFEYVDEAAYARILSGPQAGRQISLGTMSVSVGEHDAAVRPGFDPEMNHLVPLPQPVPSWLNLDMSPPRITDATTSLYSESLHTPRWENRFWAVRALAQKAHSDPSALEPLASAANDRAPNVRNETMSRLVDLGPTAAPITPQLITLLGRDQYRLVDVLCAIGPSVLPQVAEVLERDSDGHRAHEASLVLVHFPQEAAAYVPLLVRLFDAPEPNAKRSTVAWALKCIDPATLLQHIGLSFKSEDVHKRLSALDIIRKADLDPWQIQKDGRSLAAAEELIVAINVEIKRRDPATLPKCVMALGRFGTLAHGSRPLLLDLLENYPAMDRQLREDIKWALDAITPCEPGLRRPRRP